MITKLNKNYNLKENANYILEREKNILYSKYFTYGGIICSQTIRLDHTRSSTPFQISYVNLSLFLFWSQWMAEADP